MLSHSAASNEAASSDAGFIHIVQGCVVQCVATLLRDALFEAPSYDAVSDDAASNGAVSDISRLRLRRLIWSQTMQPPAMRLL